MAPERIERGLVGAVGEDEPAPGRLREASALWLQVELALGHGQRLLERARRALQRRARRWTCSSASASTSPTGARSASGLAASLAAFFVALSLYLALALSRSQPRDWPARLHDEVVRAAAPPRPRAGRRRRPGRVPRARRAGLPGPRARPRADPSACTWTCATARGRRPRDLRRLKHLVNAAAALNARSGML